MKTDVRLGVGQSREPREKVTAAKQAGGDKGGLGHGVALEAGGERMYPGWTACADRPDRGCERKRGDMVTPSIGSKQDGEIKRNTGLGVGVVSAQS